MPTYALLKDGIVENTVLWDGEGDLFVDYTTINIESMQVGIGWTYDGEVFNAPNIKCPEA